MNRARDRQGALAPEKPRCHLIYYQPSEISLYTSDISSTRDISVFQINQSHNAEFDPACLQTGHVKDDSLSLVSQSWISARFRSLLLPGFRILRCGVSLRALSCDHLRNQGAAAGTTGCYETRAGLVKFLRSISKFFRCLTAKDKAEQALLAGFTLLFPTGAGRAHPCCDHSHTLFLHSPNLCMGLCGTPGLSGS